MSRRKKVIIAVVVVVVLAGLAWANTSLRRPSGVQVTVEKIETRDLESIVSASGKIQPKRQVNISAETMGKVVNLTVNEGEFVQRGQLLLEIDPRTLETQVQNREASLATARSQLDQTLAQIENARVALREAEDAFRRAEGMFKAGLLAREQYERARNDLERQKTNLLVSEQSAETQKQRIKMEEANLPEHAKKAAENELERLRMIPPESAEHSVVRTYLEWLVHLPWTTSTDDNLDIPFTTHLEALLAERHGVKVRRLVKPSGTAPSPAALIDDAVERAAAAVVGIGL